MNESSANLTVQELQEKVKGLTPGLGKIKKIIAVASGKGGVGKSTVSTQLAHALKKLGNKVGLLDADIYGPGQPKMMGASQSRVQGVNGQIVPLERHGIKFVSSGALMDTDGPIMWRAPIVNRVLQQFFGNVYWGELDYLVIDLPPGTGDIQMTLAQQVNLNGVVIVTTPQQVAGEVAMKGLKMFQELHVPVIGVVENMSGFVCSHCHQETQIFSKGAGEDLADKAKTEFLGRIPLSPEIVNCGENGIPLESGIFLELAKKVTEIEKKLDKEIRTYLPTRLEAVEEGTKLQSNWDDVQAKLSAHQLRGLCPCASCVDENSGKRIVDASKIPLSIKITGLKTIGRYGVSIQFSDSHNTGIYRYEFLKNLCVEANKQSSNSFSI